MKSTKSSKSRPRKGEIWIAAIPFRDAPEKSKIRPVLIAVDPIDEDVLIIPITSVEPRNAFDIPIIHWMSSGLLMESCARVSKITVLEQSVLRKKIGILHNEDQMNVLHACKILFN